MLNGTDVEAGLAELLCARLCHDLAGAVGAVTAGAELLAEEGAASPMAAEALDLMAASAVSMAARLRFFRLAVGPVNQAAAHQARGLAADFFAKGFPQGDWRLDWPSDRPVASSDQAKLLLNLISLAQESLPRGGVIAVRPQDEEAVVAQGAAVPGEATLALAADRIDGLSPRAAQGAYVALLARRLGGVVETRQRDGLLAFAVMSKSGD